MGLSWLGQEQTRSPLADARALLSRFIFAMKFSRRTRAKVSRRRVSAQGRVFGLRIWSARARAQVTGLKGQVPRSERIVGAVLDTWYPRTCHLPRFRAAGASTLPSPGFLRLARPRVLIARGEFWTDALPQRNCGRISRPSPLPWAMERTTGGTSLDKRPRRARLMFERFLSGFAHQRSRLRREAGDEKRGAEKTLLARLPSTYLNI